MFKEYFDLSIEEKKIKAAEIVSRYSLQRDNYISRESDYNESQLRNDFLNEYLILLGWDVFNEKSQPQHLRDVVVEESIVVLEEDRVAKKKPDYTLRIGGVRKLFVEAKKPSVSINSNRPSSFQVKRYIWNANLQISVLTNFENLTIYLRPNSNPNLEEDSHVGIFKSYSFGELSTQFEEIYSLLSFESVILSTFDSKFTDSRNSGTLNFDSYFLSQIKKWQLQLANGLIALNSNFEVKALNLTVQRILNKILFLRICEDRNLENYKTLLGITTYVGLKSIFQAADQKYNSGLFDTLQDPMHEAIVPDQVLIQIFTDLYLPNSPFDFSIVEPVILSEIYENFLGNVLEIVDGNHVVIREKPEVVASSGVVITPQPIVERIVKDALSLRILNKTPEQIQALRIADIACGSGVFLLEIFDYLKNYHLEWYRADGEQKHFSKLIKDSQGNYFLSLSEKHRIFKNCIYGVDIDYQAVEVARFSLSIKIIEDSSKEDIENFLIHENLAALPSLEQNIICGNSLIDQRFQDYLGTRQLSVNQLVEINQFAFDELIDSFVGFDIIVGNPPYVKIQNMVQYSPEEVDFFRSETYGFAVSKKDLVDKYAIFIERALELLTPSGILSYIVPHKFMKIRSGKALRKLITEGGHLSSVAHFGTQQLFEGRLTYTCILTLSKQQNLNFRVEHVSDVEQWCRNIGFDDLNYPREFLNEDPWVLVSSEAQAVFDKIKSQNPRTLKSFADIFVGVQTSANPIYVLKPLSVDSQIVSVAQGDEVLQIERAVLQPIFNKVKFDAFDSPVANRYLIYPYEVNNGTVRLFSETEMKSQFPLCWKYLEKNREKLSERDMDVVGDGWYAFGRNQSLDKFDGTPKLVWPVLSTEPKYCIDKENIFFTGGGNGPYYGLRPARGVRMSLQYFQAILTHPVVDAFILATGSPFDGDYISHGKQFIEKIPFRDINFSNPVEVQLHNEITEMVDRINTLVVGIKQITIPAQKLVLKRQLTALRQALQSKIDNLYQIDTEDHLAIMSVNPESIEAEPNEI